MRTTLPRAALARLVLASVLALGSGVACHGSRPPGSGPEPTGDVERVPFTGFSIPGVKLFRVTYIAHCDDCDSTSTLEGVDDDGVTLSNEALFLKSGALPPAELARRALGLLLSHAGAEPLEPGKDAFCMEDPASCALMAAPSVEGHTLTFWINLGSMHPTLTRMRVDLTTAAVERTTATSIAHPPPDPVTSLHERLASNSESSVASALGELMGTPQPGFTPDVVRVALSGPTLQLRGSALGVLGKLRDPAAVPEVAKLLTDPDVGLRRVAARTLGQIGTPEAISAVRDAASRASVEDAAAFYEALRATQH